VRCSWRRWRSRRSREWQVDQAAEHQASGSRWRDTGRVFTTSAGAPLGARHIRKMFQHMCERAGFGGGLRTHRLLQLGEVTAVRVPTVEQEAARDLVRARHRFSKLL